MNHKFIKSIICTLLLIGFGPIVVYSMEDSYRLGPGDVLEVSVWKDPELTRTVVVLPDGKIGLPLIGEIGAEGKTLAVLKSEIESRLRQYMPDPILSIIVQQVNSLSFYIIGEVLRPGRMNLNSNVNILQALAMAGGLGPFANRKKIKIFRKMGHETHIIMFNYEDVVRGENLEQNILIQRGDVIVVP